MTIWEKMSTRWRKACSLGRMRWSSSNLPEARQMCSGVYVRASLQRYVKHVFSSSLGVGLAGTGGNKGAVGTSVRVHDSLVCLVSAHLAAHEGNADSRNEQFHELAARLFPLAGWPQTRTRHDV